MGAHASWQCSLKSVEAEVRRWDEGTFLNTWVMLIAVKRKYVCTADTVNRKGTMYTYDQPVLPFELLYLVLLDRIQCHQAGYREIISANPVLRPLYWTFYISCCLLESNTVRRKVLTWVWTILSSNPPVRAPISPTLYSNQILSGGML